MLGSMRVPVGGNVVVVVVVVVFLLGTRRCLTPVAAILSTAVLFHKPHHLINLVPSIYVNPVAAPFRGWALRSLASGLPLRCWLSSGPPLLPLLPVVFLLLLLLVCLILLPAPFGAGRRVINSVGRHGNGRDWG